MTESPRLMTIHAHPDDEASKGAPTLAMYAERGVETVLVCCTGGEEGEVINPAMDRPEIQENLHEVRMDELRKSVDVIGFDRFHMLGYRDSGMADEDSNHHPDCFDSADMDEAVGRLVAIIRAERPHVIITYSDDQAGYHHPDHIQVYEVTIRAWDKAGDPDAYPGVGEPWQPQKLYYSVWSRERMTAFHHAFEAKGVESPFTRWFDLEDQDHRITTRVDIGDFYWARTQALQAHATQVDPKEKFWFGLTEEEMAEAYPYDDFILARSEVQSEIPESDLFAGVRVGVSS